MDRFAESGSTEKQLIYQSALEFIGEVRAGISWERFCMHAVRNCDAFIDFLNDTAEVKEFLSLKRIDRSYVIENVKKILERLHFNPENDYYLSLGLHHSASETQIHNRWKNLMFLYHPDRTQDSGEDTNRAARKINEVYSVLKDPGKKREYDRSMTRRTASPMGAQGDPGRMSALRNVRKRERHYLLSPAMRRILPKIILPVSIVISSLVLLIIFWGNKPPVDLRRPAAFNRQVTEVMKKTADEQADNGGGKQTVDQAADRSEKTLKGKAEERDSVRAKKSVNKRIEEITVPKTPENLSTGPGNPGSFQKSRYSDEKLNWRKDQTADNRGMLQPRGTGIEKGDATSGEQPIEASGGQVTVSETPEPDNRERQQPERMAKAGDRADAPSRSPVQRVVPEDLESEVYLFLSIYINAYEKGSTLEFLSLFSKSALAENGRNYDEMRRAYQKNFISKGYKYTVRNIQVQEKGEAIIVNAVYHTERSGDAEEALKGDIRWVLIREEGDLKIARVDYDRD